MNYQKNSKILNFDSIKNFGDVEKNKNDYFSISDDYKIYNYIKTRGILGNDEYFDELENIIGKTSVSIKIRYNKYLKRLHYLQEKVLKELNLKKPNDEIEYKKIYNKEYLDNYKNKDIYIQGVYNIKKEQKQINKTNLNKFIKGLKKGEINKYNLEIADELITLISNGFDERRQNIFDYIYSKKSLNFNLKELIDHFKKRYNRRNKIKWIKEVLN